MKVIEFIMALIIICVLSSCGIQKATRSKQKRSAELYFRSVYMGNPSLIGNLTGEEFISTYPVYEQLFGTKSIRGRDFIKNIAAGFSEQWKDVQLTIHETIAEKDKVVLLWSFSARRKGIRIGFYRC